LMDGARKGRSLDDDKWVDGIRDGRSDAGDGLSHLCDSTGGEARRIESVGVGETRRDAARRRSSHFSGKSWPLLGFARICGLCRWCGGSGGLNKMARAVRDHPELGCSCIMCG